MIYIKQQKLKNHVIFELFVMYMTHLISILIGFHIAHTVLVWKAKSSYDSTC